jgi:hypothetical protein
MKFDTEEDLDAIVFNHIASIILKLLLCNGLARHVFYQRQLLN